MIAHFLACCFRLNHESRSEVKMANLTGPTTFVLQHVLQIDDVQTKKKNKANVMEKLSCEDDPESNEFALAVGFGCGREDFLSGAV